MALWSRKGGTFFSTVFSAYCQVVEFIMQQQTETKSDVMFCFSVDYISDFFRIDIKYNNKNIKYFKIFEFYYNYSNQIAF